MKNEKKVIFYESFDVKTDRWKEDAFSYYSNGSYHMYPRSFSNDYSWISLHMSHTFKNFLYESEVEWLGGRIDNGFGLAFRSQDSENAYVFSITKNGYYSIGLLRHSKYKVLSLWEKSELIKDGVNILGIACINNCITTYINGESISTLTDSTYDRGFFGFFSNANIHSRYNNAKISEINEDLLLIP